MTCHKATEIFILWSRVAVRESEYEREREKEREAHRQAEESSKMEAGKRESARVKEERRDGESQRAAGSPGLCHGRSPTTGAPKAAEP